MVTLLEEIERLVLARAVSRLQLRPDLFRQLRREAWADRLATQVGMIGREVSVMVAGVMVTERRETVNLDDD